MEGGVVGNGILESGIIIGWIIGALNIVLLVVVILKLLKK